MYVLFNFQILPCHDFLLSLDGIRTVGSLFFWSLFLSFVFLFFDQFFPCSDGTRAVGVPVGFSPFIQVQLRIHMLDWCESNYLISLKGKNMYFILGWGKCLSDLWDPNSLLFKVAQLTLCVFISMFGFLFKHIFTYLNMFFKKLGIFC